MTVKREATRRKKARLAMRLTPDHDALIRDAATITGQSLTEFVTTAAVTRAEDTLADRRVFRIDDAARTGFATIHGLHEQAATFYEKFGFRCSPTDPLHRYLLLADAPKSLGG